MALLGRTEHRYILANNLPRARFFPGIATNLDCNVPESTNPQYIAGRADLPLCVWTLLCPGSLM